ncbi:MAG: signal peptidase I [Bacteroidetes bacterium]|nr:signal peptidase I [Bacteroidota bacterium]
MSNIEKSSSSLFGRLFKKSKKAKKLPETPKEHLISWVKTIVGAVLVVMVINGLVVASFKVPTGSMENTVATGDYVFVNRLIFAPSTPQVIPFINQPLPFLRLPGWRSPRQGDVIVFIFPGMRDEVEAQEFQYYLKRCVAVAGDTLTVLNTRVYVNGKEFILPPHGKFENIPMNPGDQYQTFPVGKGFTRDNYGPIRIPKKGDIINLTPENRLEWDMFIRREGHSVGMDGVHVIVDGKPTSSYTVQRDYCFGMGDNRNNSLDSRYWGFVPIENVIGTPLIVYWSWDTALGFDEFIKLVKSIRWSRLGTLIR